MKAVKQGVINRVVKKQGKPHTLI
uniref:Uncharacterized protein n=1 Tax=Arundo donax TaxID=35708 RepID=A0A0A9C140_ARUDO